MKITVVAGARPNFVKIAPLLSALDGRSSEDLEVRFVHTGQHYDDAMSGAFFKDLGIRAPDVNLGVGSGTHAQQTAHVMVAFEKELVSDRPDLVVVVGDVNSTLACALVAAKLRVPVAHVEAGLRSFDRSMPEEINRIVTDSISDLYFTTCTEADRNLAREGVSQSRIHFVGNIMIDTLLRHRARARKPTCLDVLGTDDRQYGLLTLHRPANVDAADDAARFLDAIEPAQVRLPIVFPAHPRTAAMFEQHGFMPRLRAMERLHFIEPLPYLEFLYAMDHAALVLTDSGGIQEETTALGVPCLTLRTNTERAITIDEGTNRLVGLDPLAVAQAVDQIIAGAWPRGRVPALWDGHTAERIVDVILEAR